MGQWETTISELMTICREALVTLVPVVEKAHMRWRDEEAYDDWDQIAQAIYGSIVIMSVENARGDRPRDASPHPEIRVAVSDVP